MIIYVHLSDVFPVLFFSRDVRIYISLIRQLLFLPSYPHPLPFLPSCRYSSRTRTPSFYACLPCSNFFFFSSSRRQLNAMYQYRIVTRRTRHYYPPLLPCRHIFPSPSPASPSPLLYPHTHPRQISPEEGVILLAAPLLSVFSPHLLLALHRLSSPLLYLLHLILIHHFVGLSVWSLGVWLMLISIQPYPRHRDPPIGSWLCRLSLVLSLLVR